MGGAYGIRTIFDRWLTTLTEQITYQIMKATDRIRIVRGSAIGG